MRSGSLRSSSPVSQRRSRPLGHEARRSLPSDELLPRANGRWTHAIASAPPDGHLARLVQMRFRRSDWYRSPTTKVRGGRHERRRTTEINSNASHIQAAEASSVSRVWKRTVATAGRGLQVLWRLRLGWIAGHALLVITHVGRRTGRHRRTVLYVQHYDRATREATVISVWGERASGCATSVRDPSPRPRRGARRHARSAAMQPRSSQRPVSRAFRRSSSLRISASGIGRRT